MRSIVLPCVMKGTRPAGPRYQFKPLMLCSVEVVMSGTWWRWVGGADAHVIPPMGLGHLLLKWQAEVIRLGLSCGLILIEWDHIAALRTLHKAVCANHSFQLLGPRGTLSPKEVPLSWGRK